MLDLAPLHALRKHPFAVEAFFKHMLVLTYAFPQHVLEPVLPPGLKLDTWHSQGFLAIAIVQTQRLRLAGFPVFLGQDFLLTGYRIFARLTTATGRQLRGLRILRSDTDRRSMVYMGNLLTHYHYQRARVALTCTPSTFDVQLWTPGGEADLHAIADLARAPARLPDGSPFASLTEALRFAGPLPFTFADAPSRGSMLVVKGVRTNWQPRLVEVRLAEPTFLHQGALRGVQPVLASAFYLSDVRYRWERGAVVPLARREVTAA